MLPAVVTIAILSPLAPAEPAAAGTGPSGVWYEIKTVCSTGSMTVRANTVNSFATGDVTFDVTTSQGTTSHFVAKGATATVTVPGRIAMTGGVTVREAGVLVAEQPYSISCPSTTPPFDGISRLSPLSPRRVLDTRPDSAVNHGGGKPQSMGTVVVPLAGRFGIPADATAVVVNITATETEGPGFVQAYPTGVPGRQGESSNVNIERAGQTIPNAAVVKLGDGGAITLYTTSATHLVLDVSGAFVPAEPILSTFIAAEGRFSGITPTRVFDTRPATRLQYDGGKPTAGQQVQFSVAPSQPVAGLTLPPTMPSVGTIGGVVLNVTATEATAPGYVQVAAGGALVPGASSNLNLERADQTIPNLVIVPVGPDRTVSIFTSGGTHLVADVLGYFTNSSATSSQSGLFVPLVPERILDTRDTVRVDGGTYEAGPGATTLFVDRLPNAVGSVVLNVTATETRGAGYVQVGPNSLPDGMPLGAHSNLNFERADQTIPNLVLTRSNQNNFDGVTFFASNGTELIADIAGWFTYTVAG